MFWSSLGVGTLIDTVGATVVKRNANLIQMQSMRSLRAALTQAMLAVHIENDETCDDQDVDAYYGFEYPMPEFPQENYDQFVMLQRDFFEQKREIVVNMRDALYELKWDFFCKYHYRTTDNEVGAQELILDENNLPIIEEEGETPEQTVVRERYEAQIRDEIIAQQDSVKDEFLKTEKEKLLKFLKLMHHRLVVPEVIAELTKQLTSVYKRAFAIQQEHENRLWIAELPLDQTILDEAKSYMDNLRHLETEQYEVEEASEDREIIVQFQREMAVCIRAYREELRHRQADKNDFLDPRKGLKLDDNPIDFVESLPAFLIDALYNMGIEDSCE